MSNKTSERVWSKTKQEGSKLNIMLALAWFANDKGICFPSDEELAKRCRMRERNAQYILKDLEGDHEIFKVRNPGRGLRSYTIVTVGWSAARLYLVLRRDFQMDKRAAREAVIAWSEKGAIQRKKVQSSEKVQSDVKKVQSSVEKGAIQRNAYKEETSGKVIETSERERGRALVDNPPFDPDRPLDEIPNSDTKAVDVYRRFYPVYSLSIHQQEKLSVGMPDLKRAAKALDYCATNGVLPNRIQTMIDIYESGDFEKKNGSPPEIKSQPIRAPDDFKRKQGTFKSAGSVADSILENRK